MNKILEEMKSDFNAFMDKANDLIESNKKDCDKPKCKRKRCITGYFLVDKEGKICNCTEDSGTEFNNYCFNTGNYFKTKEEAERYRDKLIATQKLLDMCDDVTDEQWADENVLKYYIVLRCDTFVLHCWSETIINNFVFLTKEKAEQAIKDMGEKDLKLIFDIKD